MCVYSLRYPACNAREPYCHLWPARFYNIFSTLSHIKSTIFENMFLDTKSMFWFPLQLLSEIFLILQRSWQDININLYMSSCTVLLFLSYFIKNEFSGQIFFFKYPQISYFKEIHLVGAEFFRVDRQTDRHTTKLTGALRNFAKCN
jgi:hypothetical protein